MKLHEQLSYTIFSTTINKQDTMCAGYLSKKNNFSAFSASTLIYFSTSYVMLAVFGMGSGRLAIGLCYVFFVLRFWIPVCVDKYIQMTITS